MPLYRVLRVSGEVTVEAPSAADALVQSESLAFQAPAGRRIAVLAGQVATCGRLSRHSDEGRVERPVRPGPPAPDPAALARERKRRGLD